MLRRLWRNPLVTFFAAWKIILLVIGVVTTFLILGTQGGLSQAGRFGFLEAWDGKIYRLIAEDGYLKTGLAINQSPNTAVVFFPLFPGLIAGGEWLTAYAVPGVVVAQIINTIAVAAAVWFVWRIVSAEAGLAVARKTVYLWLVTPAAIFFAVNYSEPVFLGVAAAALYYAMQRRFSLAAVAVALALAARPTGVVVLVAVLIEYWQAYGWKWRRELTWISLAPLSLAAFSMYVYFLTGNALAFVTEQSGYWARHMSVLSLYHSLVATIFEFWRGLQAMTWVTVFSNGLALLSLVAWVVLVIIGFKRRRWSHTVFAIGIVLLPLASGLTSLPRFVAAAFPLYLTLVEWTKERVWVYYTLVGLSAVGLVISTILFSKGYWVA